MAQPTDQGPEEELGVLVEPLDDGETQRLLRYTAARHGNVERTIRPAGRGQQHQRYETNSYATPRLVRLCEMAQALGLQISETAKLSTTPAA